MNTTQNIGDASPTEGDSTTADTRLKVQGMFLSWLKSAVDARLQSGIEEEWQEAEDLYAGVEPGTAGQDPTQKPVKGRSRVIINITEGKTGIGASQIIRRVLPGDVRPWKIEPTPVPEFDEAMASGEGAMITLKDGTQQKASNVAKAVTQLLKDKKQLAAFPNVFMHLERLLDEGRQPHRRPLLLLPNHRSFHCFKEYLTFI